jgi:hypothetical protein
MLVTVTDEEVDQSLSQERENTILAMCGEGVDGWPEVKRMGRRNVRGTRGGIG